MGVETSFYNAQESFTENNKMNATLLCFFCFETFETFLDESHIINTEILDCVVCCNPNKIQYTLKKGILTIFEISNGNE